MTTASAELPGQPIRQAIDEHMAAIDEAIRRGGEGEK